MTASNNERQFRIIFDVRPKYLHAVVVAERDSYEISRAYWETLAAKVRELRYKNLLVEEKIPDGFSMTEAFELASEIPKLGFNGVKIAFVDEFGEQEEVNRFSEMVAVNRGLNVKVFTAVGDAEEWLLG